MTEASALMACPESDAGIDDGVATDGEVRGGQRSLTTVCVDASRYDVQVRREPHAAIRRIELIAARSHLVQLRVEKGEARYLHLAFGNDEPMDSERPAALVLALAPRTAEQGDDVWGSASLGALTHALEEVLSGHEGNKRLIAHIALAIRALVPATPPISGNPSPQPRLAEWQLQRALAIMEDRFGEALRIPDVAAACALSQGYFARAFLASTGKTPYRWLLERRVSAAQRMLSTTQLSLTEVGLACGFSEQSHFTRIFRNTVGVPPGSWRRSRGSLAWDQAET